MSFRIIGLPAAEFSHLFSLSEPELKARKALRRRVDRANAFPCRISLTDASLGDEVILTHYLHHDVDSPFRSSYAIYVREGERQFDAIDEVPEQLRRRTLALRGFDVDGMLLDYKLTDGSELATAAEALLSNKLVTYAHIHFAAAGCYAARIERMS